MTSSNGSIFRVADHLYINPPVTGGFPSQKTVTRSLDVFFVVCLKKLGKQTIETPVIWDTMALIGTSL